ncbi:unnamed protein product [Clavelina lepadiformis]|uniref:Peptidase S1 domain-containing protein n=1 Tax=Clavelina lepadiformis TaxID=159417 RepID=A0ABP0FVH6_CLALP
MGQEVHSSRFHHGYLPLVVMAFFCSVYSELITRDDLATIQKRLEVDDFQFESTLRENSNLENVLLKRSRTIQQCPSGFGVSTAQCGSTCCSRTKRTLAKRVRESEDAHGEFPWHVSVWKRSDEDESLYIHKCGGVLLTNDRVLTAAHCLENCSKTTNCKGPVENNKWSCANGKYKVTIGVKIPQPRTGNYAEQSDPAFHEITQVRIANQFGRDGKTFEHDYAIMLLKVPVSGAHFACLPPLTFSKTGYNTNECYALGHGGTDSKNPYSLNLRKTRVTFTNCGDGFKYVHGCIQLLDQSGSVGCVGDSGSPVVCRGTSNESCSSYYVVGIFSQNTHDKGCKGKNTFSVLSNLTFKGRHQSTPRIGVDGLLYRTDEGELC